jgi:hypothetical protein
MEQNSLLKLSHIYIYIQGWKCTEIKDEGRGDHGPIEGGGGGGGHSPPPPPPLSFFKK